MLALYRSLLCLYPVSYRCEYGDEIMSVLSEVQVEVRKKSLLAQALLGAHEIAGLLYGALQEHLRTFTGSYRGEIFSTRRFGMHSEYRFPKATVTLMTIILVAVIIAIEKAKAISASVPNASQTVGPIRPEQFTTVTTLLTVMAGACVAGLIGWAILFALRRSGVHRLSQIAPSAGRASGGRLTR